MSEFFPQSPSPNQDEWPKEPLFDQGDIDDELYRDVESFRRQPGITMHHPLLLLLVLGGSLFLGWKTYPKAAFYFAEPGECGVLAERPIKRAQGETVPDFQDGQYCVLEGSVQSLTALTTPKEDGSQPYKDGIEEPREQLVGVRYYVRLNGENVFAIIPADGERVHRHRNFRGSLVGFTFQAPGRFTRTKDHPELKKTEETLRLKYSIPDSEEIWLFDVATRPEDQFSDVLVTSAMGFTALLALFGLIRTIARHRRA